MSGQRSHESQTDGVRPSILTKREAAEYLRCTTRYLERMSRTGRLRMCKPSGRLVRFRLADLDAFLESGASFGGERK